MNCKFCKREFKPLLKHKRFCSKKCANDEFNFRTNPRKEASPRVCKWCGGEMMVRTGAKFCSKKCSGDYFNNAARIYRKLKGLPSWQRLGSSTN